MYATPISPRDIALGNLAWIAARLTLITTIFTIVIVAVRGRRVAADRAGHPGRGPDRDGLRRRRSPRSPRRRRRPNRFATIFRFGITPLFLFSGTFFPISSLPAALQALAWLTPLFHGVALTRGLSLGHDRGRAGRRGHPRHLPDDAGRRRGVADDPDHRAPAGARMTALRVVPAFAIGSRRSLRLIERNLYVYKHGWMVLLSGFFEPLFYLLGIGFGLGALIGTIPGPGGQPISYQLFVAPALLASAAMNGAINESTFNFFFKLNYNKTFTSILSTPLSPGDIAVGELGWALIRGGLYAIGFMGVMLVLGLFVSPWVDPRGPGGAAGRLRVRGGRDGGDVVHEDVAGLRPHPARRPADVPVLGHVLPDRRLPAGAPGCSSGSRRCTRASTSSGR